MQADVLTTLAGGNLTERHRVLVTEELFVEVFRTAMHGFQLKHFFEQEPWS